MRSPFLNGKPGFKYENDGVDPADDEDMIIGGVAVPNAPDDWSVMPACSGMNCLGSLDSKSGEPRELLWLPPLLLSWEEDDDDDDNEVLHFERFFVGLDCCCCCLGLY